MTEPQEIITAILAVLLAGLTSVHAILRRRNPHAAVWWIGVSWTLPFVGPLLYYFFGINRIERKISRFRRDAAPPLRMFAPFSAPSASANPLGPGLDHLNSLARIVEKIVQLPLLSGNRITPLMNGEEAFPVMLGAIDKAKSSVALSTYIFENDQVGGLFIDALTRAVARGVQVRVLIDDVGAGFHWRSVFNELRDHDVPVAYFLPSLVPWRTAYLNLRSHRKILTVDGRLAFSGGMNITQDHVLKINPKHPAQDIQFQIEGPVVAQIQDAFRLDWQFAAGEQLSGEAWFPELYDVGVVVARGIPDGPDEDFEKCKLTLLAALSRARNSIRIVTPYLIPDGPLLALLNLAALGGIEVDVLLPERNDMALVQWATQAVLPQIMERGVRVWRTPPPFDHSKLLLIDDGWTFFGSSNWDHRSLRLNFEFNVECYDKTFATKMNRFVDQKIASARQITLKEIYSRPLPIKLRDGIARLFSPLL